MTSGLVFDIQRFCLRDGPGIRTTVFFKGCNLRCAWCHNPESIAAEPQLWFWAQRCIRCGACAAACSRGALRLNGTRRILRRRCDVCGECVAVCPARALEIIGRRMGVDEALAAVMRDEPFYRRSGGGVTLSGGEPLAQPEFALALLRGCRERGVHVALDTAGNVACAVFAAAAQEADLVLLDLKHPDPETHRRFTGASNAQVLRNLKLLGQARHNFVVRVPVIPGFNDAAETLLALAQMAADAGAAELHLLPYHALGEVKRRRLGRGPGWRGPAGLPPGALEQIRERSARLLATRIGG